MNWAKKVRHFWTFISLGEWMLIYFKICFDVVDNFKKSNLFSSSIDDYDIAHFEEFVLGICKTTGQAIPEFFMNPEEIKEYIIKNYGE